MKFKTILLLLLLTLLAGGEARKIKRRTKRELVTFAVTFALGCAVMTAFEIGGLYNIRKLRKEITEESLKQVRANLEHRKTIHETIDYCREARISYEQKANLVLSLEKTIIEVKALTEKKVENPKKVKCAVKTDISEEELAVKIKEFGQRIQEMEKIYGKFKQGGKMTHFEPVLKKPTTKQKKALEASENESMFCVIKKVEASFKKFRHSVLGMAQLDMDEMCDVDVITGISEFNKKSAARINKIKTLEGQLKSSSNIIYRMFMNKSFKSMSASLEHVAAVESKDAAKDIRSHSSKWENTKESRKRALISLGTRLASLLVVSGLSAYRGSINDKISELSKKIPTIEKYATAVVEFRKRFILMHASGKKYAEGSAVIDKGSNIPALFGFFHFSEVAQKIGSFFNYKTIAGLVKSGYSSIFKDEIYKSFLPDTWNRVYFRKLALRKDFTVNLQVLEIKQATKEFESDVAKYFRKGKRRFEIKKALRKSHFKGYDTFREFQLRREMTGQKNRDYFKKDDLFIYDVEVAHDRDEVFALAKRGFEILSIHFTKKKKEDLTPAIFNLGFYITDGNKTTLEPFYVMGTKQFNEGGKATVHCQVFKSDEIKFNFRELQGNFKSIAEQKMKVRIEKTLRDIYVRKCGNIDSIADFTEFISSSQIKIKVLYNHFLACTTVDRELYKDKYNKYAQCFNKYHSGKSRQTRFNKAIYAKNSGTIRSAGIINKAKRNMKSNILKLLKDLYGTSKRRSNELFDSEELNFSILKRLYEVDSAEKACKAYKKAISKVKPTIILSKEVESKSVKDKMNYLKKKTKVSIKNRFFGGFTRMFTQKKQTVKYEELTFNANIGGVKDTLTVNDYFLLAHNKALSWRGKDNFNLERAKARTNVFISVFGDLLQCSKTQKNLWKLSNEANKKVETAVSRSKGKYKAFILSALSGGMMDYVHADRDFFRVNSLFKFKVEKRAGFYQAFGANWSEPCNFASWATAIKFKRKGNFEFRVSKGTYEIEISVAESKQKRNKMQSTVIMTATVLEEKEEKDEKSVYNKLGVEEASERRCVGSGYTKMPADEFGEPSDIRIALNDKASLYLSFWTKRNEKDFKQLYNKTCNKKK